VVRQHHAADFVFSVHVGALSAQGHLDPCGPPWNEVHKTAFANTLQSLVHLECVEDKFFHGTKQLSPNFSRAQHLRWVHVTLDDFQDGHVAPLLRAGAHHDVLGLQQAAHYLKDLPRRTKK
jgi:hypothetical protein